MSAPTLPLDSAVIATQDHSGFAVVFEDVWLAFEENEVLRGVSFRLPLGETKALFGVAGAGKSTILKLVLGLLKPDAGRITVLGAGVAEMREQDLFALRGKIGMVFQESALFDSLTVRENVAFRLMEEHGIYSEDIDRRVREALSFVELDTPSTCCPPNFPEACDGALPSPALSSPSRSYCSTTRPRVGSIRLHRTPLSS